MREGNIVITSNMKHILHLVVMAVVVGVAWGSMESKVSAVEDDKNEISAKMALTDKKIEVLASDVNKQAVTIGQIVVNTKNIVKQLDRQQRILERISEQLTRPPNN